MLKKIVSILIILIITVSFGGCGSEKETSVRANNTSVAQDELQETEEDEQAVSKDETNNSVANNVTDKEKGDNGTSKNTQSEVETEKNNEKETENTVPSNNEGEKNDNSKKELVTNTYFDPSRVPEHKDSQGNKIYYITPSKEYQSGNNYCTIGFGVDVVSFDVYQCSITNLETGEALPIRDKDSGVGATVGNCLIVTPDAKIETNVKYALYIPANTVELSNGTFYDADIYHEFVTTVDTRW